MHSEQHYLLIISALQLHILCVCMYVYVCLSPFVCFHVVERRALQGAIAGSCDSRAGAQRDIRVIA